MCGDKNCDAHSVFCLGDWSGMRGVKSVHYHFFVIKMALFSGKQIKMSGLVVKALGYSHKGPGFDSRPKLAFYHLVVQ